LRIEPFKIAVAEQVLSELKTRIRNTRWPDSAPDAPWSQGTDLEWLRNLMDYWAEEFGSSADTISSTGRKCPVGGHFPALEEPELLVEDIRLFFRALRSN
jgi:hypothetical protein